MHFPDFKTFDSPGKKYREEERDYKDELRGMYEREVRPLVERKPERFLEAFLGILRTQAKDLPRHTEISSVWRVLSNLDSPGIDRNLIGGCATIL